MFGDECDLCGSRSSIVSDSVLDVMTQSGNNYPSDTMETQLWLQRWISFVKEAAPVKWNVHIIIMIHLE